MVKQFILSPPLVFIFFLVFFIFFYRLVFKYSTEGQDHPEKYLPYSSGQGLPPGESYFSYTTFFRIGLLFAIMHVTALIVSTLTPNGNATFFGLVYLIGMFISAFALAKN